MNIHAIARHSHNFFQTIRRSLPSVPWAKVQNAFGSIATRFRSKPTALSERQIAPFNVSAVRKELFPDGIVEKVGSRGVLRQVSSDRFEFVELGQDPISFGTQEAFIEHLESLSDQVSFWEIEIGERIFYKYWDPVNERFENFLSRQALYYAMAKDGGGAFRLVSGGKSTYIHDRSGYFSLNFQEFESEALFLEVMQREAKRRAFRWKCFAGVAAGAAVGAGAYAYYANRNAEEGRTAIALPQTVAPQFFQSKLPAVAMPHRALPNITLTEEIPYQSQEWIISDIFGSAMNGATVTASILPQGIEIVNRPIRVVTSVVVTTGSVIAKKENFLLFSHPSYLDVMDMSKPLELPIVSRFKMARIGVIDWAGQGNYLFALQNDGNANVLFAIMNVADPIHIRTTNTTKTKNFDSKIVANDNDACFILDLSTSPGVQLYAYDVSNKFLPQLKNKLVLDTRYQTQSQQVISSNDSLIVYIPPNTIQFIDVTQITSLRSIYSLKISDHTTLNQAMLMSATENRLYLMYTKGNTEESLSGNFMVYDISSRMNPRLISTLALPFPVDEGTVVKDNDLIYVHMTGTQFIIDVENESNPSLVNTAFFSDSYAPRSSFVYANFYFYSAWIGGINVATRGNTFSLAGNPLGGTQGNYPITLTATDQQGKTATSALHLSVKPAINVQLAIPDQFAIVGSHFNFFIEANTFKHINNVLLTYSIDPKLDWLQFNQQSGALSGTPKYADTIKFKITAKDGNGATASTTLNLKVVYGPALNHAIGNQAIATNEPFSITIPKDTFIDKDSVGLSYSVTNNGLPLPSWLKFDPNTLVLSGTPTATDVGTLQIVVQAKDPNGLTAETYFQLQVSTSTGLTLLNPIANQIALVGQLFRFYIPSDTFVATGYTIKYSVRLRGDSPLPGWLEYVNQTLSGTPGRGDTNSFSDRVLEVVLTAHTGAGIGSHVFNINVSGQSYAGLAIAILGPTFSAIGAAFAAYQKRALLLNRCCKKRYVKPDVTALIGQAFSRTLSVRSFQVRNIQVLHNGQLLPRNGELPHGFRYNYFNNAIEADAVPASEQEKLTVQVIGKADKILEQFDLNISTQMRPGWSDDDPTGVPLQVLAAPLLNS